MSCFTSSSLAPGAERSLTLPSDFLLATGAQAKVQCRKECLPKASPWGLPLSTPSTNPGGSRPRAAQRERSECPLRTKCPLRTRCNATGFRPWPGGPDSPLKLNACTLLSTFGTGCLHAIPHSPLIRVSISSVQWQSDAGPHSPFPLRSSLHLFCAASGVRRPRCNKLRSLARGRAGPDSPSLMHARMLHKYTQATMREGWREAPVGSEGCMRMSFLLIFHTQASPPCFVPCRDGRPRQP